MDIKQTFDNEAEEYEYTSRAVNIYFDEALECLVENIGAKQQELKILDVCCGTGILTEKVAKKFPNAHFTGVDFSTGMLAIAKKRMEKYSFDCVVCDICDDEGMKKLGEFDLIISSFGVHNVHGKAYKLLALENVLKHLKKGGQYITCDLVKGGSEEEEHKFEKFQRDWLLKSFSVEESEDWMKLLKEEDDPETLEDNFKLLEKAGLKNVKAVWQKEFLAIWTGEKI